MLRNDTNEADVNNNIEENAERENDEKIINKSE